MNKGMRDYIEHLERDMPSHVIRIKKEVSPEFEIPAILQQVENRRKQPVLIFEKVRNLKGGLSKLPVVVNLFGSRERLADAIGSSVPTLPQDYIEKEKPIPPVVIDKARAAVKQVIQKGAAIDLYELPIVTHDLGEAVALADRIVVLSSRPGRIVADVQVDLPRPRSIRELQKDTHFHELYAHIWASLESGWSRHEG